MLFGVSDGPGCSSLGAKVQLFRHRWQVLRGFFIILHPVMMILLTVLVYFAVLFGISHLTSRRADNNTFYRANRRAPWYMVAFGMVGASISGVTFVSVPGMVLSSQMTYLQMCLGFIVGYLVIAFVLLPLYYRLNLTTIYGYLGQRLGERRREVLRGVYHLAAIRVRPCGHPFYRERIDDGGSHLAIHPSRRHRNPRIHRCLSDVLPIYSPRADHPRDHQSAALLRR